MKTRKSIYDDPAVVKSLLAALRAAEEHGCSAHVVHCFDYPDRHLIVRPDSADFPLINVRTSLKKLRKDKQTGQQQNMETRLKIVSTRLGGRGGIPSMSEQKEPLSASAFIKSQEKYAKEVAALEAQGHRAQSTWTAEELIHGVTVHKADSPEAKAILAEYEKWKARQPEALEKQAHLDAMQQAIDEDNLRKAQILTTLAESEGGEISKDETGVVRKTEDE